MAKKDKAQTTGETAPATETKATRTRSFSRLYDYVNGTVEVAAADGTKAVLSLASIPESIMKAFAIGAYADYIVNLANDAVKAGVSPADAFKVMAEADAKVQKGELDFRTGAAAGESIGVTMLVGRALVELGKTALTFKGVRHVFATVEEAGAVCRALYDDADEKAKDEVTKLTGRQFFTQIKAMPAVAEKLASFKPAKQSAVAASLE